MKRKKKAVWVVADTWILEAGLGGQQLAEVGELDLSDYEVTYVTQAEFDAMMEEFFKEHGHYPDQ